MAEDETRHAALAFAFATVRWLVGAHPELAPSLAAERAHFEATATAADRALLAPLLESLPHVARA